MNRAVVRTVLAPLGLLIVGGIIGWFACKFFEEPQTYRGQILREDSSSYSLIDPILACDIGQPETFPELKPIKQAIASTIAAEQKAGDVQDVSVYVRLLKSGKWFDINPDITYAPASLLKVFVMTSYYKQNEDYGGILNAPIVFQGSANALSKTPGEVIPHLTNGATYSVRDVIRQMIIYSDNDALDTLLDHFDQHTLEAYRGIFNDLNIPLPEIQSEDHLQFMTVSEYATIFRVLYGATYLSRTDSQKALELLADVQYKDGIVAGVPGGITVAHKFGVKSIPATKTTTATSELHDCGIVYYPEHPYLLCVMTRGKDFGSLQNDLAEISRTTYQAIDTYYTNRAQAATTTPAR